MDYFSPSLPSYKKKQLELIQNDVKSLNMISRNLDGDTYYIVHGYIRNIKYSLNDFKVVPLDVIDLVMSFVGYHFDKIKVMESCERTIKFISNTYEPIVDYWEYRTNQHTYSYGAMLFFCVYQSCICCCYCICCRCFCD